MEELCRICLSHTPRIHSIHISHRIALNKTVAQVVNECSSVQMSDQDSFPKYLCSKCYQQLLVINEFRELIIKSDAHMKKNLPCFLPCYDEASSRRGLNDIPNVTPFHLAEPVIKHDPEGSTNKIDLSVKNEAPQFVTDTIEPTKPDLANDLNNKKEHITRMLPGRKPSKMSKHKRKVHEFKCDICKKVLFGRSNRLEQHIIMAHSDIKNFVCETCNKKFKSKQQLVNHTRVHTGEKPYCCDICKETFASSQNLFNHKKRHTGKHKSYKCELCEKAYSTPGEMETHRRIVHTGEKPFLCEICSRAYSSARNLGLHIRSVHEKTEKCPKCGLMLSNKRIKQHIQKHQDKEADIRRYTCDKCAKGFFTPHALKKHQVVHTGERPYSCEVCRKSFSQKSAVDTHMKTHSDVRSFCCELCAKTFKYKQHLRMHMVKNHGDQYAKKLLVNNTNSSNTSFFE